MRSDLEHLIDQRGGDAGTRHVAVFGLVRILHEAGAAALLDPLHAHRAVRAGAREHHRDRPPPVRLGQRAEEDVDRRPALFESLQRRQDQMAVDHPQALARRNHVNVVRLDVDPIAHLPHRHGRDDLEHLGEPALVLG